MVTVWHLDGDRLTRQPVPDERGVQLFGPHRYRASKPIDADRRTPGDRRLPPPRSRHKIKKVKPPIAMNRRVFRYTCQGGPPYGECTKISAVMSIKLTVGIAGIDNLLNLHISMSGMVFAKITIPCRTSRRIC